MTSDLHDNVVAHVARTRFPFPGQTTWPDGYQTIVNVPEPRQPIQTEQGSYYPDIVILDRTGRTREIGEVELALEPSLVGRWRQASEATDNDTLTGVHHFFIYVPAGQEDAAKRLLEENGISYAGVRGFTQGEGGAISIVPFVTKGDPYDHQ